MAKATIYIGADTSKANTALGMTSKSVANFGKATLRAGATVAKGLMTMTAAFVGLAVVVGKKAVDAFIESENAQMRLTQISKQVLKATDEQIQAFKDQATALQKVTTLEDDAIMNGQSQLASFTRSTKVVEMLTGGMTDLAVAQYGASVNGEQMIQTANMIGKALGGQLGAMTRAGILVTDDLRKAFEKANTEEERAAVISEILASNYGGLAEAAAKTAEGGLLQLKNTLGDMGEEIGAVIIPAIVDMIPQIKTAFDQALPSIKNIYTGIIDILTGKQGGGEKLAQGVGELMGGLVTGIANALPQIITAFTGIMQALVTSVIQNKEAIFEAAKNLVTMLGTSLIQLIPEVIALGIELFTVLLQSFASANIAGEITNAIVLIVNAITENLPAIIEAGMQITIALTEGLIQAFPQIMNAIIKMMPMLVQKIVENLPAFIAVGVQLIEAIVIGWMQAIPKLLVAIWDGIKAGADKAYEAGKNIISGMIKGLTDAATNLYNEVERIAKKVISKFKGIFGIHSPSTLFAGFGKNIMQGWANGILDNRGLLENAMGQSINSLGQPILASAGGSAVNNYSYSTYAPQTNMSVNSLLTDKGALMQLKRLLDNAAALENVRRGVSL